MGISAYGGGIGRGGNNLIKAPLPLSGRRWAVMGDSISANGGITGTMVPPSNGFRTMPPHGYINWLAALSLQCINIEPDGNFSIAGRTTAQIASVVQDVIAYKPAYCIVEGGTNDPGNNVPVAQSIANVIGIYDALLNAGIGVVAIAVTPRTAPNGYTATQNQQLARINHAIRRYAATRPGIIIADPRYTPFVNQATNGPADGMTLDDLHPNQAGAKVWGDTILAAVSPFIELGTPHTVFYDSDDVYDPVANTTGNMLNNGLLTSASGGTLNGASLLTGAVPAGWTAIMTKSGSAYTGTIALSNAARPDATIRPGNLTRITAASLSGGGAQDHVQLFQQVNLPVGVVPGDVCEVMAEVFVNATSGFTGMDVNMGQTDGNGGTTFTTGMGPATNSQSFAQGTYHVILKTPRMMIGPAAGASQRFLQAFANFYFDTSATGPATATIDVGSISLRKINGLV